MAGWRKVVKVFEDSFTASAFAEAGEFETAKRIIEDSKGWVVLAGQGNRISKKICAYVRSLCESTRSKLQIVWKGSLSSRELEKKLKGIPFEVSFVSGDLEEEVPLFLRHLRRISMVVFTGERRRFRTFFNRISLEFVCPLVIISEKELKG